MAGKQAKKSKTKDSTLASGEVRLEISSRLPRRIRAGITVSPEVTQVTVTEAVAKVLESDRYIKVKRL